ncbi:MAG: T9SS type A sorting domain-containing protein, partial [Prolixibacteraceae bacterium]|nr:T9SS type A sorting domain-containing protein [Prolixibacteraceae bacterium]
GYTLALPDPNKDNMLGYNWNNSVIKGGTPGLPNSGVNPVTEYGNKITDSALMDCYPNPFNTEVNIPVSVTELCMAGIDVYNLNGELIETVFNGSLQPGIHQFLWKTQSVKAGVYIVAFKNENGIQIKKIVKY